jgi:hypothetical protein
MASREERKDRKYRANRGEDSDDDTKAQPSRSRSRSQSPPSSFHRHHLLESYLSTYVYGNRLKTFSTFDDIFYELLSKIRKENLNPDADNFYDLTKNHIYNKYIDIANAEASKIVKILLDTKNGGSDATSYRSNPIIFLYNLVTRWLDSNNQRDFNHIKLKPEDALHLKENILIILKQEIAKQKQIDEIASEFAAIETQQTRNKRLEATLAGFANLGTSDGGKTKYNKTYCRRNKKTRRCRHKKTRRRRYRK